MSYVRRRFLLLAGVAALFAQSASARAETNPCGESLLRRIPAREAAAPGARAFVRTIGDLGPRSRDSAIRAELLAGNIPDFLRRLVPVTLNAAPIADTAARQITLCVLPDYLSVGSDRDFVITPMQLSTAVAVARRYGFVLPTARIVDAIYAQARARLRPQPLPPGARVRSTDYLWRHNELILAQRVALQMPGEALVAGHKKDLVITARLRANPLRVAIYGWHRADGIVIQPLSAVRLLQAALRERSPECRQGDRSLPL